MNRLPIDTTVAESPGWWLARLIKQLADEAPRLNMLDEYYRGTNVLPTATPKAVRESYQRLMYMARTNFAELAVEAVRERMVPTGFRTGAANDQSGDDAAWAIWQGNNLDADKDLVHSTMLSLSKAYAIVGPIDEETGVPVITPEDPRQVTAICDPVQRRKVRAAVKVFRDDVDGRDRAYLYFLADGQPVVAKASRAAQGEFMALDADNFEWDAPTATAMPDGVTAVPVVPFLNRVSMVGGPSGEFEPHLGILDRIAYTVLSRLEIATLQAFRQRAVKGVPTQDADGVEINYDDIFSMDPGAIWLLPATAELWESGVVDLGPIRQAIRDDIQDFAAVTRTPLFYFAPDSAEGSAEGASLKKEGLTFKTADRINHTSESWERVMSLAFQFTGDTQRASRADMQVIWAPPERYSLSERADAATKALAAGMPWQTVMETIWLKTPQEITRMKAERAADVLVGNLGGGAAIATPLDEAERIANIIQSVYLGVGKVLNGDEARALLNRAGAGLEGPAPVAPAG